jgi:hypothetical protein
MGYNNLDASAVDQEGRQEIRITITIKIRMKSIGVSNGSIDIKILQP